MLEIIKSFFSPVGGGRTSFASQNGNQSRKEDLRQGRNLVSNSDFNKNGGELYLNQDAITSENIVGGGQLRSTNQVNASSRSIRNGGEGNYASLMSSNFADTWTMLTNSDHVVGGGRNQFGFVFKKGGKPLFRLASYTRNDFFMEGGAGCLVCTPFHYEGGVC